ncbi:MAG: FAD:protein FMN transferase [Endomicrobiales bacterium]|jgi:thiamine biosynthesis lipoprotein
MIARKFLLMGCVSIVLISGCNKPPLSETRFLFDTHVKIVIPAEEKDARIAIEKGLQRMEDIEKKFDVHKTSSPFFKFNNYGTPMHDKEIADLMRTCCLIAQKSDGLFDPTVFPLVKLWGFFEPDTPSLPSDRAIKQCLKRVGYDKLIISSDTVSPGYKGVAVDMGGIIPGYAGDEVVKVLKNMGIKSALIDTGGEIYALGTIHHKPWRIGLKNPRGEGIIGVIEASNKAVVTSGDYERFFEKDGRRYHHILNPKTGYPSQGIASVTTIGPNDTWSDAWGKVIFLAGGVTEGFNTLKKIPGYEAVIVTTDSKILFSPGLQNKFKKTPPAASQE